MVEEGTPVGETSERRVLTMMIDFLLDTANDLRGRYKAVRDDEMVKVGEVIGLGKELRDWAQLALQERAKIDKLISDNPAGVSHGEIDFAEARASIGRRLARLRAVEGAGGVSEGADGE